MSRRGMSPAELIRAKEADRTGYRGPRNKAVRETTVPVGTNCGACSEPLEDGDLVIHSVQGWAHGRCRVFQFFGEEVE